MSLSTKRVDFSGDFALLVSFARHLGYLIVICEVMRDRKQAKWNATHCRVMSEGKRCEQPKGDHSASHAFKPIGSANSVHCNGLAGDLLLVQGGKIVNARGPYERLGKVWKAMRAGNRWGGDFEGFADLGHFSREHRGRM